MVEKLLGYLDERIARLFLIIVSTDESIIFRSFIHIRRIFSLQYSQEKNIETIVGKSIDDLRNRSATTKGGENSVAERGENAGDCWKGLKRGACKGG